MSTLATLASLKLRLGIDTFETDFDAQLTNFLKLVTGRFEAECNRTFARAAGAYYEFSADQNFLVPELFPIESVSAFELKDNEDDGWVAQTGVSYRIGAQKNIVHLFGPLGTSDQGGRITYTGGYVLPDATAGTGQTALPSEIEQAAIEQAAFYWQNRDRLGLTAVSGEGGSVQQFGKLDLLPTVIPVLANYERWLP